MLAVFAQTALPKITVGVDAAQKGSDVAVSLQILLLLTVLTLAPSIILMMTSFARTVIVFSFLRHALSLQQIPPTQVVVGLSLFMTLFIMYPTWNTMYTEGIKPYVENKIDVNTAYDKSVQPLRTFMIKQTREKDIALFVHMAKMEKPKTYNDIPTHVLIPSFIISELRVAFQIGFLLFIPFLVIDMVVASLLMSMGMMMLPPVMISLPFKVLLFVLVDGWYLVVMSLMQSFK